MISSDPMGSIVSLFGKSATKIHLRLMYLWEDYEAKL
jgi:hypothetical protein